MKFRFVSFLFFFAILGFNCLTSEEVTEDFMFYTLLSTSQPGYALLKILDAEKVEKINKGYVGFDVDIFNNRITI
ncbi:hypothetical protein [Winogradskyella wichelsiae]|uniref:hypothetical protein n=1 Tax=Winogradskyella wichelsiae TaxID=2697007 RepID=UPI0015C6C4EF|nr:hypothetical protein [Winogradskyella wichelsiae]